MTLNKNEFIEGVKAGMPVAIGYIPIAVAFGILAKSLDVPNLISLMMSVFIYAGASQFIGLNLLAIGSSLGEIVLTTFLLNLRHFLMSAALSQRIDAKISKNWRLLLSFGVTDETFALSALKTEKSLSRYFILGLHVIAFAAWNIGTWLGIFFSNALPAIIKASMGIALYAMFIGLLIPQIKKSKSARFSALLAIILNSLVSWYFVGVSGGIGIIISTIISAAICASVYKEEELL